MNSLLVIESIEKDQKVLKSFFSKEEAETFARRSKTFNPEAKIYIAQIISVVNYAPLVQDLQASLDNFPTVKATQTLKIDSSGKEIKGEVKIFNDNLLLDKSVSFDDLTEERIKHSMIALHQKWGFFNKKMLVSSLAKKQYEEVDQQYIRKVNRPIPKLLKVLNMQQSNIPVKGVTLHYVIHRTEQELNQARKYFRKVG